MEIKSSGQVSRRGQERTEFLFWAKQTLSNAGGNTSELMKARSLMRAWESMLDSGSEEKKDLLTRKERIELDKQERLRTFEKEKDGYGILEKYDNQGKDLIIEINSLWELMDACEQIQEKYGLRND